MRKSLRKSLNPPRKKSPHRLVARLSIQFNTKDIRIRIILTLSLLILVPIALKLDPIRAVEFLSSLLKLVTGK